MDFEPLFGKGSGTDAVELDFRFFPSRDAPRWLLESRFRRPWHLKTWPRTSPRARLIYRALWAASYLGLRSSSKRVTIKADPSSIYMTLRDQSDALSVFVGTPGPNRKFVIFTQKAGQAWFVKVPAEAGSFALVQREAAALDTLSRSPELSALIPRHRLIDGHLAVESVETAGVSYGALANAEVLRVCRLLEQHSRFGEPLGAMRARFDTIGDGTLRQADAAIQSQIDALRDAARGFWSRFDPETTVELYDAHGDFTQWNVLRAADGGARIIDWELYGPKPRYFDLIHYHVAQFILVRRIGPAQILAELAAMAPLIENRDTWWQYVGHYFVVQSLYYATVYERQAALHAQAIDQLATWTAILQTLATKADPSEP